MPITVNHIPGSVNLDQKTERLFGKNWPTIKWNFNYDNYDYDLTFPTDLFSEGHMNTCILKTSGLADLVTLM